MWSAHSGEQDCENNMLKHKKKMLRCHHNELERIMFIVLGLID